MANITPRTTAERSPTAYPSTTAHPMVNMPAAGPALLSITTGSRGVWMSASAVAAAVLVGGLTSFGQLLPGTLNWFANSVSGWTIPMVVLVWFARGTIARSALTGGLAFVAMSVGYALVSTLRGYPDTPWFWAAIGIAAGPVLGAATALLRHKSTSVAAISGGILGGIVIGDGVRGLLMVAEGWGTWSVFVVVGVAFVIWHSATRLRTARTIPLQLGAAVVVAGSYVFFVDGILDAL